jgi:hypothetical protein
MAVPKTSVDENYTSSARQDDIRRAGQ